jgi:hypothetical protein
LGASIGSQRSNNNKQQPTMSRRHTGTSANGGVLPPAAITVIAAPNVLNGLINNEPVEQAPAHVIDLNTMMEQSVLGLLDNYRPRNTHKAIDCKNDMFYE